jgi:hypothetical protein
MPDNTPENRGAFEASATPKHNGNATKKTTRLAVRSLGKVTERGALLCGMSVKKKFGSFCLQMPVWLFQSFKIKR